MGSEMCIRDSYKGPETDVIVRLRGDERHAFIEVFNQGTQIEPSRLEEIFNYGVSDNTLPANLGLGLFVSRAYVVAMRGTIRAENRDGGVAIVITLPLRDLI